MPLRRRRTLPLLLLAASAWLAAGPGGVTVLAATACPHHMTGHRMPGRPCFCDHMTGTGDVVQAPALAPPVPAVIGTARAVTAVPFPLAPAFRPDVSPPPIPPPPIAGA